jgi:hypothetical protein
MCGTQERGHTQRRDCIKPFTSSNNDTKKQKGCIVCGNRQVEEARKETGFCCKNLPTKCPGEYVYLSNIPAIATANLLLLLLSSLFTACFGPYGPSSGEIQLHHLHILKKPSILQRIRCFTIAHSYGVRLLLQTSKEGYHTATQTSNLINYV